MTHEGTIARISEWMRFWAPEVRRRIEKGEKLFAEVRDAYEALRKEPKDEALATACWARMGEAWDVLSEAPPGSYDWLVHAGACTKYVR